MGDQEDKKSLNNQEKRTRRMSSSSSTKSREGERKKPRFGFDGVEEELTFQSDTEEWSEGEYVATFKDAPEWARGMMNYLKLSVGSIKESTNRLKVEAEAIHYKVNCLEEENQKKLDGLVKAVDYCSSKYDNWMDEKSVLLQQISEMKADNEMKFDEQYSRRNCSVITGLPDTESEDTDIIIHNLFLNKSGTNMDMYQIDRSHRLGPRHYRDAQTLINRPIIVKFATYLSRKTLFNAKKMLRRSGVAIFENLTKRRVSLLNRC